MSHGYMSRQRDIYLRIEICSQSAQRQSAIEGKWLQKFNSSRSKEIQKQYIQAC